MYQVKKRNGQVIDFNLSKISNAITKAFEAKQKPYNQDIIDMLALKVTADFMDKVADGIISVEDIQDSVETVLIQAGYADVAKAYILYRKQHENVRKAKETILDYKTVVDNYLKIADWRVKENSTVTYSVGGLILSNSGAITANYWLSEVYDEEIAEAHRTAAIHLHDLSMLSGYCAGWSLKQLIQEGLGGVPGKITSAPAKHLASLCNQMVNFLGIMQNEWAGAQAFSSFDTYLAPFVKADNLTYDQVKKCVESFVYGVNTPSRWGTQAPFSNITLDWTVPDDLAELNCIVGGKEMDFKYKDCKKEMDMINKAFIETMIEGDYNGRGFQYPIPTYSITKDFDWSETENNKLLFEMTAKYGTPYFSNYINSDMQPSDVRSMCCRLRLDLRELRKKIRRIFRKRRKHRFCGRSNHQYAPYCLPFQKRRGILPTSGQTDGHFRTFFENKAQHHHATYGSGIVSLHKALPRHFQQPLFHNRTCGNERSLPQRKVDWQKPCGQKGAGIHQKRPQPHA